MAVVAAVVAIPVLIVGARAFVAYDAVVNAQDRVGSVVSLGARLDLVGVGVALDEVAEDVRLARAITDGADWSLLAALPVVGDDVGAVRATIALVDDLVDEIDAAYEDSGLEAGAAALLPRAGAVDLAVVDRLIATFGRIDAAVLDADARLAAVDRSGLLGPVAGILDRMAAQLGTVRDQIAAVRGAVDRLPAVLGVGGPRTVLLLIRDAERDWGSGGAATAVAAVTVTDGAAAVQVVRGDVLHADDPVDPSLDPALSADGLTAASTVSFPAVASALADRWVAIGGSPVDMVIAVDSVGAEVLLGLLGEVAVGETTATPAEAVALLLDAPGPRAEEVAEALVGSALDSSGGVSQYLSAAADVVSDRHLQIWSAHPDEQTVIAEIGLLSGIPVGAPTQVSVYADAEGAATTSGAALDVATVYCAADATLSVTVTLADTDVPAPVVLIGPVGAVVDQAVGDVDGAPVVHAEGTVVFEAVPASLTGVAVPGRALHTSVAGVESCPAD